MKRMPLVLLSFGALGLLCLSGCAARTSLAPESGKSIRLIFKQQAKKRTAMKVEPLTASEALTILANYEKANGGGKAKGKTARSSSNASRPKMSGNMSRLRRNH